MFRKLVLTIVLLVLAVASTGCYFNEEVDPDQFGVQVNKGKIQECIGPGLYTDMGWFADIKKTSQVAMTFSVEDPEVATKDNQLVGIKITIQARRASLDCNMTRALFTSWSSLLKDDNLIATVSATAREGIKIGTRSFILEDLLNDRNGLSTSITKALEEDSGKYGVEIVNVTIENVALNPDYAATMQAKALYTAEIDKEKRRQDLINQTADTNIMERKRNADVLTEQLAVEKAQTQVNVEIASRKGKEIAAQYQIYLENAPAYELERLRLLANVLGEKSVFYFLPEGTDLDLLFTQAQQSPLLPVPLE